MALDCYNTEGFVVPTITLKEIDARTFNVLCNGPLKGLFPAV
jgi:hypothetical protein